MALRSTKRKGVPVSAEPEAGSAAGIALYGGGGPLYQRLADFLTNQIERGEYKVGEIIPGDKQLASEHGVSLITVRAAMRVLIDRGLVARYPGKGSFVVNQQQIRAVWGLGSVDDLLMTGKQSKLVLLRKGLTTPPDWVAYKYGTTPLRKVYWLRTVRVNKRERFMVTDVFLPPHIGKAISQLNFNSPDVRNEIVVMLVVKHLGLKLGRIDQTMSAELASRDVARSLGIKRSQPVLVIDRDYISTQGELIQVARTRYRVDHFRYTINVAQVGGGAIREHGQNDHRVMESAASG